MGSAAPAARNDHHVPNQKDNISERETFEPFTFKISSTFTKNALAMKKDLRNHLLFRPMPANVLTLCTKCHASHADEKGKRFFWASLHVFWTWALLLDLTTILLEMATLLLDLRVLLDLILPSCSTWPFPKPYPGLHRNFSDSRALELHFIFPNPKTVDILPKRVRT